MSPPAYYFLKNFPTPRTLIGPPAYQFSQISILATVRFSKICYQVKVFKLIYVYQRCTLVENEWISLGVDINSTNLCTILRNRFPNLPLTPSPLIWTPRLKRFSRFFSPKLLFGPPPFRHCKVHIRSSKFWWDQLVGTINYTDIRYFIDKWKVNCWINGIVWKWHFLWCTT